MEIYKDLESTKNKEFANLLNSQTNNKIEEGKIFEATITKISSSLEQELQVAILKKAILFEKEFSKNKKKYKRPEIK